MTKRRLPEALLLLMIGIYISTLDGVLSGSHVFRQAQVANVTRYFGESTLIDHGFSLNPVRGLTSATPFEFPFLQAAASLLHPEVQVLGLELLSVLLMGGAVFLLLLFWRKTHRADLQPGKDGNLFSELTIVLVITLNPLTIEYTRQPSIEWLAIITAVGTTIALFHLAFFTPRDVRWSCFLVAISTISALAKITTFLTVIPALTIVGLCGVNMSPERTLMLSIKAIVKKASFLTPAIFIAFLWTRLSDSIKEDQSGTDFITSTNLRRWNFGTIEDRLSGHAFRDIFQLTQIVFLGPVLAFCAIVVVFGVKVASSSLRGSRNYIRSYLVLLAPLLGVAVFTNLYIIHDYYWLNVLVVASVAIAGLVAHFSANLSSLFSRGDSIHIAIPGLVLLLAASGYAYLSGTLQTHEINPRAVAIAPKLSKMASYSSTPFSVVTFDFDWSPELLYLSNTRGFMFRNEDGALFDEVILEELHDELVLVLPAQAKSQNSSFGSVEMRQLSESVEMRQLSRVFMTRDWFLVDADTAVSGLDTGPGVLVFEFNADPPDLPWIPTKAMPSRQRPLRVTCERNVPVSLQGFVSISDEANWILLELDESNVILPNRGALYLPEDVNLTCQ